MTSTTEPQAVAGRLARALRSRLDREADEGGFILLEVMISLTLITAIMAAVSVEYVNGIVLSASQRTVASASQVASTELSKLRTVNASDLLRGRDQTSARAQRQRLLLVPKVADRISAVEGQLAFNDATASRVVPTAAQSVQVGTRSFTVDTYLECQQPAPITTTGTAPNQVSARDCHEVDTADGSDVPNNMRATVAVVWQGSRCPSTGCAFVASTLIDTHANPTFDVSQPLPPTPLVAAPGDQTVAVGQNVSLQLLVQDGRGAAPFTWALTSGSLPAGLTLSPSGLVSGTVGGAPTTTTTTITVTDAFLRQATVTVKWTVIARLVLTNPGGRTDLTGSAISPLTLTATGGSGGYRFTDPNGTLPNGLTLAASTGQVTGTPTRAGTFTVRPVVTDSSGTRTATTTFTWTINTPPFGVSQPGAQVATVNRPESVQVTASGGSGSFRYSAANLPAGLTIGTTTGLISGTPSTVTGKRSVTVTATDTETNQTDTKTFDYTVVAAPRITTPSNQTTSKGATVDVPVSAACENGPCRYTIANQPNGITIDESTGRILGSPASNAASSTTVRVTVTDHALATATTSTFSWTINEAPTAIAFGGLTSPYGLRFSFNASVLFTGGTGPYRYSASGLPSGASLDPGTGVVSGTLGSTRSKNAVTITQTDSSGAAAVSSWNWWVSDIQFNLPNATLPRQYISVGLGQYVSGGVGPYTYLAVGLPPGLSINGTNLQGTPQQAGTYTPTIRVTDSTGAFFDARPQVTVQ